MPRSHDLVTRGGGASAPILGALGALGLVFGILTLRLGGADRKIPGCSIGPSLTAVVFCTDFGLK
jgi:hypothetical protein